ncbi:MAG TPA: DUF1778 domain-containing protein [Geminicoccaceae bacterium]|nr:DUF1778 domain-containing protein [Geminicoccaceae bacterium]
MVTISMRVPPETRDLINRAAKATGRTRTDFMLETARKAAEEALLDQRFFHLDAVEYTAFREALDAPPRDLPQLRKLLTAPAPWRD